MPSYDDWIRDQNYMDSYDYYDGSNFIACGFPDEPPIDWTDITFWDEAITFSILALLVLSLFGLLHLPLYFLADYVLSHYFDFTFNHFDVNQSQ